MLWLAVVGLSSLVHATHKLVSAANEHAYRRFYHSPKHYRETSSVES